MRQWCYVGKLQFDNGADSSILHNKNLRHATALMFITGALVGTVTIKGSPDSDSDVTPSSDLYVGTTQVSVPASKTTIWESAGGMCSLMAHSSGTETTAAVDVYARIDMDASS